jgi:hypothetical protein
MLDAIAEQYLTCDNSASDVAEVLASMADADLAVECIEHWSLDLDQWADYEGRHGAQSHMQREEYSAAELAAAFGRFRAHREER